MLCFESTVKLEGVIVTGLKETVRPNVKQWSRYWQTGARTSLPLNFDQNYDGEIEAFWSQCFQEIGPEARVADVCCGNGAVAMLAATHSERRELGWSIQAIDAADLDIDVLQTCWATQYAAFSRIDFQGGVPVECLSPSSAGFDLICSQYGLEYCNVAAAAPQLLASLAPAGRLVLVSHINDSEVHRTMRLELAGYGALEEAGVLRLLNAWHRHQLTNVDFIQRIQSVGRKLSGTRHRGPLVDSVLDALAGLLAMTPEQLKETREQAGDYRLDLLTAKQRAEDLLAVMDRVATNDWLEPLIASGFSLLSERVLNNHEGAAVAMARVLVLGR